MPEVSGTKLVNLADLKLVYDAKLDKDISELVTLPNDPAQSDILLIRSSAANYKVPVSKFSPTPVVLTITTGQWTGNGPYTYSYSVSNVTADTIMTITYDETSAGYLTSGISATPSSGSVTISTDSLPTGSITVMMQLVGVLGEAEVHVLPDAYSTTQTDSLVNGSRVLVVSDTVAAGSTATISDSKITSDMVPIKLELGTRSAQSGSWTITTSTGSVTITGTISASTTVKIYLEKKMS